MSQADLLGRLSDVTNTGAAAFAVWSRGVGGEQPLEGKPAFHRLAEHGPRKARRCPKCSPAGVWGAQGFLRGAGETVSLETHGGGSVSNGLTSPSSRAPREPPETQGRGRSGQRPPLVTDSAFESEPVRSRSGLWVVSIECKQ